MTKGVAYYSDLRGDQHVLQVVRDQLQHAAGDIPIVAVTLGRCATWTYEPCNMRWRMFEWERGYLTMFRQQLAALEALDTDVVFFCEHDVLYSPTHFDFTPPRDDTFYYNQHTWRVDAATGRALFYYCSQVSGLCASRALLLEHYQKRVAYVEANGFQRNIGFEPGSNRRVRDAIDPHGCDTWMSPHPNVDIKTSFCLTPGRWSPEQFRNKNSCTGWQEADAVPGWGVTKGRFADFLADVSTAHGKELSHHG